MEIFWRSSSKGRRATCEACFEDEDEDEEEEREDEEEEVRMGEGSGRW